MAVLLAAVLVHAAAGMALRLVAQVERVVLRAVLERQDLCMEAAVALERAALRARRLESLRLDANGNAGAAMIAMRAVGEGAAAAKARPHELRVDGAIDEVAGGGDLGASHALRQVTAGIGRGRVELQDRQRELIQIGHRRAATSVRDADSLPIPRAFA